VTIVNTATWRPPDVARSRSCTRRFHTISQPVFFTGTVFQRLIPELGTDLYQILGAVRTIIGASNVRLNLDKIMSLPFETEVPLR